MAELADVARLARLGVVEAVQDDVETAGTLEEESTPGSVFALTPVEEDF